MWYDILIAELDKHLRKCPHHKPEYHYDEIRMSEEHLYYEGWQDGDRADVVCPWVGCGWRYSGKLVLCLDLDSLGEDK